jgi:1-deoxy-D-xylulose 5-phosphate reductoisomerase
MDGFPACSTEEVKLQAGLDIPQQQGLALLYLVANDLEVGHLALVEEEEPVQFRCKAAAEDLGTLG